MNNPIKPWNPGDSRVEKYMNDVREAVSQYHTPGSSPFINIYNRCYEAVWKAIKDLDKKAGSNEKDD
jgi:hypothetical protein